MLWSERLDEADANNKEEDTEGLEANGKDTVKEIIYPEETQDEVMVGSREDNNYEDISYAKTTSPEEGPNDIRRTLLTLQNEIRMIHEEDETEKIEAMNTWKQKELPKYKDSLKVLKDKMKKLNRNKQKLIGSNRNSLDNVRSDEELWDEVKCLEKEITDLGSKIDEYDSYDSENEVRGPLLGDSTVGLVRSRL